MQHIVVHVHVYSYVKFEPFVGPCIGLPGVAYGTIKDLHYLRMLALEYHKSLRRRFFNIFLFRRAMWLMGLLFILRKIMYKIITIKTLVGELNINIK